MDKLENFLKYSVLFSYYGELFPKKKRQYFRGKNKFFHIKK